MSAQYTIGEVHSAADPLTAGQSHRFTRYWVVSRSLMLLWLLLSLWRIGAFPLAEGDGEAANVLMGFRFAWLFDDPGAAGALFMQGQLPLSYLPSFLGAHLLPVSEFSLRLPYALVGAAQMPLLLALASHVFGRRVAAISGLLLLGTGLFAINRLTLGIGVFVTFELAGALFLLRYIESGGRRWIVFSSTAFAAASLTFPIGVVLLLTTLVIAWWKRRDRRDIGMAILAGPGLLIGFAAISAVIELIYQSVSAASNYFPGNGIFSSAIFNSSPFAISPSGFAELWTVYLGVPVVSLVIIGLVEAVFHNRSARTPLLVLMALAASYSLIAMLFGPGTESVVFAAPLVIVVAAFGWEQLLRQLQSVATQAAVAMAMAAVAFAGVAWNQAVFSPETEFSSDLQSLRKYALSLEHGRGLFVEDANGIKAIAQVLRTETEPGARVFVRDDVSAAAISMYAARNAEYLNLHSFSGGATELDGAFLVIKGEDESFNAGLSGATNVVANHRVFADGESLYQLVEFRESGERFQAPIWWRSDVAVARLFRENTKYSDYLTPIKRVSSTD